MKLTANMAVVFILAVATRFALADHQNQLAQQWRAFSRDQVITLDHSEDAEAIAPRYFEDIDGWLTAPDENPDLLWQHEHGFAVQRFSGDPGRRPLSLAAFVDTGRSEAAMMVRITLRREGQSSRELQVRWDGKTVATFDTASDAPIDRPFFALIPAPIPAGVHELRLMPGDAYPTGRFVVKRIDFAGTASRRWASRPALPQGGSVQVLGAYYLPDPKPPVNSNNVEGDLKPPQNGAIFKPLQRLYQEHADFGGARVLLRNNSMVLVRIGRDLRLNGKPIEDSYVDFLRSAWDARGVVWHRMRPWTLQPGQCAEWTIRFRRRPAGDRATVTINPINGAAVQAVISFNDPGVSVDFVIQDETGQHLYVYARRRDDSAPGRLTGISLDGVPMADTAIYGAEFPGNVALAVAKLSKPMKIGAFHVAAVHTSDGRRVAAQFRVLPFFFMRTSWQWRPASLADTRETHMNTVMEAQQMPLSECIEHNVYLVGNNHARTRYRYFSDEPDAHDAHPDFKRTSDDPLYTGEPYAVGLGRTASQIMREGRIERLERFVPQAASYIIINGTTRPLNWAVYGQLADIASTDPYPCNYYGCDLTIVREALTMVRQCGAPRIMHACLETYHERPNPVIPRRAPAPTEYRQMVVQAIGCAAKGLTSWFWPGGGNMTGVNQIPPLRAEFIRLYRLIEHIEDDLMLGVPIDIVTNDAGLTPAGSWYFIEPGPYQLKESWMKERLWSGALLCGPDTLVIAAVNHIPASKTPPRDIEPVRDVTITVKLPAFLPDVSAFEATPDGVRPFESCTVASGNAILSVDAVESGRIFLLRRK